MATSNNDNVFEQTQIGNCGIYYRIFHKDVSENLLVWHRDHNDRYVTVLSGTYWQLQFDNCLPLDLIPGDTYYIPKESYHRIIKGSDRLCLIIIEDI